MKVQIRETIYWPKKKIKFSIEALHPRSFDSSGIELKSDFIFPCFSNTARVVFHISKISIFFDALESFRFDRKVSARKKGEESFYLHETSEISENAMF